MADSSVVKLIALGESVDQLTLLTDIRSSERQFSKAADARKCALELRVEDAGLQRLLAERLYLARRGDGVRPLLDRLTQSDPRLTGARDAGKPLGQGAGTRRGTLHPRCHGIPARRSG